MPPVAPLKGGTPESVAGPATIRKMAQNCINFGEARPTPPTQTLWSRDPKTFSWLNIVRNQRFVIFQPNFFLGRGAVEKVGFMWCVLTRGV